MGLSKIIVSSLLEKADIKLNEDLTVNHDSFFSDVLLKGSIGLGDSYIEGRWDSDKIDDLVFKILSQGAYQKFASLCNAARFNGNIFVNFQDRNGSNKVIQQHYDLPVEFYTGFLDPFLQYTCGFFDNTLDLNIAQEKKMDLICQKLELHDGSRVLDIGGGWGGLARFMQKRYGVKPTVITLSEEQGKYIQNTSHGIDVWINDYRDIPKLLKEPFDAISAIGIFEHIGHKNYSEFMRIASHSLAEGGKFLLQTLFTPYSVPATNPWLNKHIFPNGELPLIEFIKTSAKGHFREYHNAYTPFQDLTPHYYQTLMAWDKNLKKSIADGRVSIPEKEQRKWHFYFMSCAGAIEAEHMRVGQFLYVK
jgi:cyclopropane-fatty-acyl-phospholipid synthase